MTKRNTSYKFYICIILLLGFLVGCGTKKNRVEEVPPLAEGPFYEFEIIAIPNATNSLTDKMSDRDYIAGYINNLGLSYFGCVGETIYRTSSVCCYENDDDHIPVMKQAYIQYLKTPYEKWISLPVDETSWEENKRWHMEEFQVTENGEMQFLLYYWTEDVKKIYAIGKLYEDGRTELIQKGITETDAQLLWVSKKEEAELSLAQMREFIQGSDRILTGHDKTGNLYFGDSRSIWCYDGSESKMIIDWKEQEVALNTLENMTVTEDGFLFLASFAEKYYMIKATETDSPTVTEKVEIVLADAYPLDEIQAAIDGFNMQNRKYRIVYQTPKETLNTSEREDYLLALQKEISAGKGPDILGAGVVEDMDSYGKNGALLPLDDYFIGKEELFWSGALQAGLSKGKRYGMPFGMMISYLMTDGKKNTDLTTWNARELMDYVKKSGAKYMTYSVGDNSYYGHNLYILLSDGEDPTYIDWKNGISHLNEQPFLDVLEFVKEYSQPDNSTKKEEAAEKIRSGEFAIYSDGFQWNADIIIQNKLYDNQVNRIGYPSLEGKGIHLLSLCLHVNSKTKYKEGIYEFFDYFLSDEGQRNLYTVNNPQCLPIRRETMEWLLNSRGEGTSYAGAKLSQMGLTFSMRRLSEDEQEQVHNLLERTEPTNLEISSLMNIIYEEAAPFFEGQKTAKEVAEIIHSRVQLLLYEKH